MSSGIAETEGPRILFFSHDSVGLGHMRRNLVIAHRFSEQIPELMGATPGGILTCGIPPCDVTLPTGFDWLGLPSITKRGSCYFPRNIFACLSEVTRLRSRIMDAVLSEYAPDLVIIDRHIYAVAGELRQPLHALRRRHPDTRIILGLRDVLDSPDVLRKEWAALGDLRDVHDHIDEIWVYTDPRVHDPVATGEVPDALHDLTVATGYLASGRARLNADRTSIHDAPFILTTVGGGSDGRALLEAAARVKPPEDHQHLIVAGPQLDPASLEAIRAGAHPRARIIHSTPGIVDLIDQASAVISMGGYNTVCEILATHTPAVIVPRQWPRREQLIRARALEAAGAVDVANIGDVSPDMLGQWVQRSATRTVDRSHLNLGGLDATARAGVRLIDSHYARRRQGAQ